MLEGGHVHTLQPRLSFVGRLASITTITIAMLFAASAVGVSPAGADSASDELAFVSGVNGERGARGIAPLRVDAGLTQIARAWSTTMASTGTLAHNPSLNALLPSAVTRGGENVAYGPDPTTVHRMLVGSATHLANMVQPAFNAVGVGVVWSGNRLWVTEVFAAMPLSSITPLAPPAPVSTVGPFYRVASANGSVATFGNRASHPMTSTSTPTAAIATTPSGHGYWLTTTTGAIYSFGDAPYAGSLAGMPLAQPIVAMASTPSGQGYWLVGRDGGVFSFGDARFFGSTGNIRLNQPVVGMAATPSGQGYWFVAADGGVFSFGDARFFGSTGNIRLNQAVVGMAARPGGDGYWMVARDGGDLRLRQRTIPRLDRQHPTQSAGCRHAPDRVGRWLPIRCGRRWRVHLRRRALPRFHCRSWCDLTRRRHHRFVGRPAPATHR